MTPEQRKHADLCRIMVDQKPWSEHPWARMALSVAARAIERGRHLTEVEKVENLAKAFDEEGEPMLARTIREMVDRQKHT